MVLLVFFWTDPRIYCVEEGGRINLAQRRCYFPKSGGSTQDEANDKCHEEGYQLVYPRSSDEMKVIMDVVEAVIGKGNQDEFHVAFMRDEDNYVTLDEGLDISEVSSLTVPQEGSGNSLCIEEISRSGGGMGGMGQGGSQTSLSLTKCSPSQSLSRYICSLDL